MEFGNRGVVINKEASFGNELGKELMAPTILPFRQGNEEIELQPLDSFDSNALLNKETLDYSLIDEEAFEPQQNGNHNDCAFFPTLPSTDAIPTGLALRRTELSAEKTPPHQERSKNPREVQNAIIINGNKNNSKKLRRKEKTNEIDVKQIDGYKGYLEVNVDELVRHVTGMTLGPEKTGNSKKSPKQQHQLSQLSNKTTKTRQKRKPNVVGVTEESAASRDNKSNNKIKTTNVERQRINDSSPVGEDDEIFNAGGDGDDEEEDDVDIMLDTESIDVISHPTEEISMKNDEQEETLIRIINPFRDESEVEMMSVDERKDIWFSDLTLSAEAKPHVVDAEERIRRKLGGGRKKSTDALIYRALNESWTRFQKGKAPITYYTRENGENILLN
jgi:hypothetical protein